MANECAHTAAIHDVTPGALGCEDRLAMAASALMPDVRSCRVLR